MIIENIEALKSWLTKTLEPICDADPSSLAKYVVALVKKDKPEKDVRESCIDQLEVFLQGRTKDFVDELFNALKNKDYIAGHINNENLKPIAQDSKTPHLTDTSIKKEKETTEIKKSKSSEKSRDVKKEERRRSLSRSQSPRERRRDYDDRRRRLDDRRPLRRRSRSYSPRRSPRRLRVRSRSPRDRGRSWSRSRSRSRSRPRSWSRSRSRSRSKERKVKRPDSRGSTPTLDNGKYGNSAIGVIPSIGGSVYSMANSERYPVDGGSTFNSSARPRCKDYDEKGFCMKGDLCPFDHGADPVIVDTDVTVPPPYQPGAPVPPLPPNGAPRMPGPGFIANYGAPVPPHVANRPPLRPDQYEPYNPEAPAITGPPPGAPPFWHGPPPMAGRGGPPGMPPFMSQPSHVPPHIRQRDHLITIKQEDEEVPIVPPGTEPLSQEKTLPKENIKIEVKSENTSERTVIAPKRLYNSGPGRGSYINPNYNKFGPTGAKRPFDYSRIGYKKPDETITQLEVRKIPKEFNNISQINEHFSKFGSLTNIQVNYEGDPEAALVQFSSNSEALACYRSSEPLFNNRFVKVFWHKNKSEQDDSNKTNENSGTIEESRPVKERLGPPVIPDRAKLSLDNTKPKETDGATKEKPTIPPVSKLSLNKTVPKQTDMAVSKEKSIIYSSSIGNITKTLYNPDAIKMKAALKSPTAVSTASFVSKIEAIKKQEELKKEVLKKKKELEKQKQDLLTKQFEQQKTLIGKLEKNKAIMTAEEKAKIMETLKTLSVSIEKIKGELFPKKATPKPPVSTLPEMTPDEARKEILDTELELFNKQHTGEDTSDLKKKLAELTKQAAAMGLLGGRGRGTVARGRATKWVAKGFQQPGRGRGHAQIILPPGGSRSLDNRPKQLEVTGITVEDNDELLEHFSLHCQVDKIEHSADGNSAIVSFKTRQDAEKALIRGVKFKDKTLIMKWCTGSNVQPERSVSKDSFQAEVEDAEEEDEGNVGEDELDEEALLAGDDDDEDDEESRSWRR